MSTKVAPEKPKEAMNLDTEQAKIAVDAQAKQRVTSILKVSAFIDLAGLVLLAPAYNLLAINAANGPPSGAADPSSFPADSFFGIEYSLAVMLFGMCSSLGGAIGKPITGSLSDTKGRKFVILLCLSGGAVSYVWMFIAGFVFESYMLFLVGNFLNGLFGGSRGAIQAYLMDVWGPEFRKIQPGLFSVFMYGGAGGGILGTVIIQSVPPGVPGRLFLPAAVAAALSVICTLVVYLYCPEPPRIRRPPKEKMVFNKLHKEVHVNDKGEVGPTVAGPWVVAKMVGGDIPAGVYPIDNEIKGSSKGEKIDVKVGGEVKQFVNVEKNTDDGAVGVPKKVQTILWTIICAGALDNFGDSGTTFARSALMTKRWPVTVDVTIQGGLVILTILLVKISMELIVRNSMKKQRLQLKWWVLVGNLSTSFFQYCMIPLMAVTPTSGSLIGFILVWGGSKCFGFTSTLGAMFILPGVAPPDQIGKWMGLNAGMQSFFAVITPVILWALEGGFPPSPDPQGGTAVLAMCGSVSLVAALWYLTGMIVNMPAPLKAAAVSVDDLTKYQAMAPQVYMLLPFDERQMVMEKCIVEGKKQIHVPWGKYEDDLPNLQLMLDRAPQEYKGLKANVMRVLTNKQKMTQWYEASEKSKGQDFAKENDMDFEKERAAFGEWIASYLDDAGYHSWIRFSFIYKTMIMTAFPPLEDLDNRKGNLDKKTMQEFEQAMITWLEVFDRFNDGAKSVSKLEASITNPGKFGFRV